MDGFKVLLSMFYKTIKVMKTGVLVLQAISRGLLC